MSWNFLHRLHRLKGHDACIWERSRRKIRGIDFHCEITISLGLSSNRANVYLIGCCVKNHHSVAFFELAWNVVRLNGRLLCIGEFRRSVQLSNGAAISFQFFSLLIEKGLGETPGFSHEVAHLIPFISSQFGDVSELQFVQTFNEFVLVEKVVIDRGIEPFANTKKSGL